MRKNSFVEGSLIATLAIVVSKVMGILYVIPFYAVIGTLGSSLYSYAYNIYVIFLNISSAGIPVAISKLVSEYDSKEMKEAKVRSFKLGIIVVSILSIICFLILVIFAKEIVLFIIGNKSGGNTLEDIILVIRVIAFSVLIIPFLSVSRGYLQGHKYISSSSFSQVIEQIVRIAVVLIGSYITIKVLEKKVALGVGVALAGSFIGGLVAIGYVLKKIFNNKSQLDLDKDLKKDNITNKEIFKKILIYSIPFIIINVTVNFFNIVDMTLIIRTLGNLGFSGEQAEFVASAMTTWGYKLNMIVNAIATGLTISLIPNLVSAYTLKKTNTVNKIFNQALQIVLYVSVPAAVGLSFLSAPVWNIFYGVSDLGPIIFRFSILTAIFCNIYLISIQTAQSINAFKTVCIAVVLGFSMNAIWDVPFMHLCNYLGLPAFYGATLATILGYIVAIGIVLYKLIKYEGIRLKESIKTFGKILISVLCMVGVLSLLKLVYPYVYQNRLMSIVYVAVYALIGGSVYLFITHKFGLIKGIFEAKTINRLVSKLTFGKVKLKGEDNDTKED